MKDASPWHPMTDPVDLKHLGKFAEELNECGAAVARCIIQGIDEAEPVTGKINRAWLTDEIADVLCNASLVIARFGLDPLHIEERFKRKAEHLTQWHAMAGYREEDCPGHVSSAKDPKICARCGIHVDSLRDDEP